MMTPIRTQKVAEIRSSIANDIYNIDGKIDAIVNDVLSDINAVEHDGVMGSETLPIEGGFNSRQRQLKLDSIRKGI